MYPMYSFKVAVVSPEIWKENSAVYVKN